MTAQVFSSAAVAALFGLHPLHVESVAWVAERKDVLSTAFGLMAIHAYISYIGRPSGRRYFWVVGFFAFALMSKPMLVTLPFLLLILDFWPLKRFNMGGSHEKVTTTTPLTAVFAKVNHRLILEKIPLFILTLISCIITYVAQHQGDSVVELARVTVKARIENSLISYIAYLGKTVWPLDLAVFYPHRLDSIAPVEVLGAFALLLTLSLVAIRFADRFPYLLAGWLWYIGTLIPVIGLVQVGNQSMADRYTYIPLIGIFLIVVWSVSAVKPRILKNPAVLGVVAVTVFATLGTLTHAQVKRWQNTTTLFTHTANVTDKNYLAYHALGVAKSRTGEFTDAVELLKTSLKYHPEFAEGHFNIAVNYANLGNAAAAITHYLEATRINPSHARAYNNLATVYYNQNDFPRAVDYYAKALRIIPEDPMTNNNLGLAFQAVENFADAAIYHRKAVQLDPGSYQAYYLLGLALERLEQFEEAVIQYRKTISIKPDFQDTAIRLERALSKTSNGN